VACANPELDTMNTENDSEMNMEAEDSILHPMVKVHDFLEMWRGKQNLCVTQNESRTQNKQSPTVGQISDTEDIVTAS